MASSDTAEITTRTATEADTQQLEHLEARAWDARTSPNPKLEGTVFGKRIPLADTIVAVSNERVVGYAALGRRTAFESNAHIGVLRAIVVDPEHRRTGVARLLLSAIERAAIERRFRALRLSVMSTNAAALALYQSAGWLEVGRYPEEFHVADGYVDDVLLGKRLGA